MPSTISPAPAYRPAHCGGGALPVAPRLPSAEPPRDRVQLSSAVPTAPTQPRKWQDEILYFIMTDRFANGDKSNDIDCDPSHPDKFHGGDWQGVIDHLDDLKKLGATTLWLSPAVLNDTNFFGAAGYHGYWVQDFYKTDPHLGDMTKLKELVDKAHQRDMKVVLDLIVNHTGYNHPWVNDPQYHDWFHHEGNISFVTETAMEKGNLHGLPDLAQENPKVSKYLIDMAKWWVHQTGIDGYRVDAVKHVPRQWLKQLSDELHQEFGKDFLLVGEAYAHTAKTVASYHKDAHLNSLFDFPVSNAIRSAVGYDESRGQLGVMADTVALLKAYPHEAWRYLSSRHGNMNTVANAFDDDGKYADPSMLATMVDNHDMPRFGSIAGPDAREKLKLALTLMLTSRGIPCLYQGTEDGMGLNGESNRDDKKWGQDPDMFAFTSRLTHLRQGSVALRRGEHVSVHSDSDVYCFARLHPQEQMVVVANRSAHQRERRIDLGRATSLPRSACLQDVFGGRTYPMRNGKVDVTIPARGALILRRLS